MRKVLYNCFFLIIVGGGFYPTVVGKDIASSPAVHLSFNVVPVFLTPLQSVNLGLTFQKDVGVEEKRLVFILEMRQMNTNTLVLTQTKDNQLHGYTGDTGEVSFDFTVPESATGMVYFRVWAVPWSLNHAVVEHFLSYPTDGTYKYEWTSGSYGVTQNIYYLGSLIAPTNATHTTYCSGITFETFLVSYNNYNSLYSHSQIGTMSASGMKSFRQVWYGVTDADKLSAKAITQYNLGEEITDWEEMQRGDIIQLWRRSGSGHSVIFDRWERDGEQNITGLHYWSTQTSTDGIGYRSEFFGDTSGLNKLRFWPARLRKPRDNADYDWALGLVSTEQDPTAVFTSMISSGWLIR